MSWIRGTCRPILALGFAAGLSALCLSCSERYSFSSSRGILDEGHEGRTSVSFEMNRRPVMLELYIELEASDAILELDHPDGRTIERIEVPGPGIREVKKEIPKEPGSWGLRLTVHNGKAAYWAALHDRKKFVGPDETGRQLVEGR